MEAELVEGACLCGAVRWTFEGPLESVTACNCSACRRYGTLWAYGYDGHEVTVTGPTQVYKRSERAVLGFHFCGTCGCVVAWRATSPGEDGRLRIAVNVRLATEPEAIAPLLIDHFDGLETFDDLPRDGRCVKDMWF